VMSILADIGVQDGVGIDDVFWFVCGLAATVTALGVLLRPMYWRARAFMHWWEKFARDWDGEDGDVGRDRVPGVMERLNAIDGELKRNGGSSLKDQVCAMHDQVDTIVRRQGDIAVAFAEHARQLGDHLQGPGRTGYDPGRERL